MSETEHIDGSAVLDRLLAAVSRYVVLPSTEAADAVVLWIAASHAQPAWMHAPRLVVTGPEKRCGKSRLLDIIEATCHDPLITVNASEPAIYRSISDDPPTLLVDEADTIFGPKSGERGEALRGLLNAGHQRNRPALRYDAATRQVEQIPTFAMAALAGIGALPDTIEDRAVMVRMRRRRNDETVAPYRLRRDRPALRAIAGQLDAWIRPAFASLEYAEPDLPVDDRAADTWEPLVAIADDAGAFWPERARYAAKAMTDDADAHARTSDRLRLLTDCRNAFGDETALPTKKLLDRLRADRDAPWADYGPAGLTGKKLGDLLGEYDIHSANIRFPDGLQAKGYQRADFLDAWSRYCPPEPGQDTLWANPEGWTDAVPAVCIACRKPLDFDDGTHTHPTCGSRSA